MNLSLQDAGSFITVELLLKSRGIYSLFYGYDMLIAMRLISFRIFVRKRLVFVKYLKRIQS